MVQRSVGLILVLLLAMTVPTGAVTAQEDEPFATVVVPAELLGSPIPERGGVTWDRAVPWVGVYADGELCVGAQTFGARDDFVIELRGLQQAAPCRTPGSLITFTQLNLADEAADLEFATQYELEAGATLTLDSFAPLPPPQGDPAPEGSAFATVLYPADQFEDQVATSEEPGRGIIVLANGQRCGSIDYAPTQQRDNEGNAVFALGGEGQPAACRTPGAIVTFRQSSLPDVDLVGSFFVDVGDTLVFENILPAPPDTGAPNGTIDDLSATVVISGPLLASPVPERGGPTWAQVLGSITVLADGERCASADLIRHVTDTDFPLTIGGPAQPEACSQEGATLTFIAQKGNYPAIFPLAASFTLVDRATFMLETFAPLPPPLDEPAQVPEGEAFATVRFPQDLLDRVPNPWQDDAPTFGEIWQTMSIHANGELCGVVDTAAVGARNAEGAITFALGTADQPGACRTEGALITFHRGDHPVSMMALMLWLERDATLVFNDASGGIEDPPVIRPDGPPAPPLVGTGLQSTAASPWIPWLVIGSVVLAAASVGSFWMARRTC